MNFILNVSKTTDNRINIPISYFVSHLTIIVLLVCRTVKCAHVTIIIIILYVHENIIEYNIHNYYCYYYYHYSHVNAIL